MTRHAGRPRKQSAYCSLCSRLGRSVSASGVPSRPSQGRNAPKAEQIAKDLRLAEILLSPGQILVAANRLMLLLAVGSAASLAVVCVLFGTSAATLALIPLALCPIMAREWLLGYPSKAAKRRCERILRSSVGTVNIMVMSLRHEPSMPEAMALASKGTGEFAREVEKGIWAVIMGKYASFEEALLGIGNPCGSANDHLKTALNSMVTACRESTDDGRRRALDRANSAVVSGAKQRIEEYALSLSMPSMLIFGLGILLPLMVGSFLPMLSWNIWSVEGMSAEPASHPGISTEMILVMNVLFPGVAAFVASSAVSGHPLERPTGQPGRPRRRQLAAGLVVASASVICSAMAWWFAGPPHGPMLALLAGTIPLGVWMMVLGSRAGLYAKEHLDDVLFRTGARMLDGENFESSLRGATSDIEGQRSSAMGRLVGQIALSPVGRGFEGVGFNDNELEGLRISRQAAAKDELGAGALAMDVATYMKDLRELENSLKTRLKPTISMMKTTALILAPIVLGVTYAIYLTLGSMMGGPGFDDGAGMFFLVLGVFLAEMDGVVVFFVWGIEGAAHTYSPVRYLGACLMVSELAYAATALAASGI